MYSILLEPLLGELKNSVFVLQSMVLIYQGVHLEPIPFRVFAQQVKWMCFDIFPCADSLIGTRTKVFEAQGVLPVVGWKVGC